MSEIKSFSHATIGRSQGPTRKFKASCKQHVVQSLSSPTLMTPYFEIVRSFADVPVTPTGIETASFLEASDGLVQLFDLFGSAVFGFVQNDIRGNIHGVRSRYNATPAISQTLESLVENESKEAGHKHATACLVRLIRGLAFTCQALQNTQNDTNSELHVCFKRSYDSVLRHHHTFVVRSVVSVAIRAVPRRADFYHRLAQGGSREKLDDELRKWLVGLDAVVQHMRTFLERGGYGRI